MSKTIVNKTILKKDLANKKIVVTREFAGSLELVWQAWTDSKVLDQWWAPKPYKTVTKSMDFREGGYWLYAMEGPKGERHWARADFKNIVKQKSFEIIDYFCDENGKKNAAMPSMSWKNVFTASPAGTKVEVEILFPTQADLEKTLEMGFEQGFTDAHGNLDELLAKQ